MIFLNKNFKIEIDLVGAYINNLYYKGVQVFHDRLEIKTKEGKIKQRGGNHVCFPHFGNNEKIRLPQHGFARDLDWNIVEINQNENKLKIVLEMKNTYSNWESTNTKIIYIIEDDIFETKLIVKNLGGKEIELSPGFHPYYHLISRENIEIDGKKINIEDPKLNDSLFMKGIKKFSTSNYEIEYETNDMEEFVVWTDLIGEYLCVEPTYNSAAIAFDRDTFNLKPNEEKEFLYKIKIKLK